MNVNYNNLYCDYIGATGGYSISDYIDITSNTLAINSSNFTSGTSNILNDKIDELTSNTYHININNPNCLINTSNTIDYIDGFLYNVSNTYIYNNYENGEIRFKVKDEIEYLTKISRNAKLYVYIKYKALRPTIAAGWYDVSDIMHDYMGNTVIWNGILTGYGADLIYLQEQINVIDAAIEAINLQLGGITGFLQIHTQQINELIALQPESVVSKILDDEFLTPSEIATNIIYNGIQSVSRMNTGLQSLQNLGGVGLLGWVAAGTIEFIRARIDTDNEYKAKLLNIYGTIINNSNASNLDVPDINNPGKSIKETLYTNIYSNLSNIYINENINNCNINILNGFINSNITTEQLIPSLRTSLLNLNSGNITNVNNITSSGKIKENNIFLESKYATINYVNTNLFNNSYSQERLYPPKTFNSYTLATTSTEILGRDCFKETITLTSDNITYGSGTYNIYSSSSYGDYNFSVFNIFNFTTNTAGFWGSGNYNYNTGFFNRTDTFLKNNYFGDWVVIKLLSPLILNRFKLYYTNIYSAPALWHLYGSNDGLIFTEIIEGGNFIDALNINNYSGGFYEKIFDNTKEYLYIGIVINKIIGGNISASYLNFGQFQLYGVNVNNYNNVYTTSNAVKSIVRYDMPDVGKRQAFYVSIPNTATYYDGTSATTYYKYDLDLRNYTKTQTIALTSDLMRVFKIRFWYVPSYFGSYINSQPYVSSYEVYMSNKSIPVFGRPETAGLNIYAVGFPENNKLANILPNQLMLLRNVSGSLDYLTIVSRTAPCDIYVIIEDMLY
jgi:hypothetical protein